jgi:hypothetical protein
VEPRVALARSDASAARAASSACKIRFHIQQQAPTTRSVQALIRLLLMLNSLALIDLSFMCLSAAFGDAASWALK